MDNPKKSLGQNFIKDKNICRKIVSEANVKNKKILEIGPGYGFLTDIILESHPKKVILIEKDDNIYDYLSHKYKKNKKIVLINMDILKYDLSKNMDNYSIISNTPYNISSKLIGKIIKNSKYINEAILMLQKEVAFKYNYKELKMNKYKFITEMSSTYKICFNVPNQVFFPKPKVKSTIVKFTFKKNKIDWNKVDKFITIVFSKKRKILSNKIDIDSNNLKLLRKKRIEDLNFSEIMQIYKNL